jgi:hypothetical protein
MVEALATAVTALVAPAAIAVSTRGGRYTWHGAFIAMEDS